MLNLYVILPPQFGGCGFYRLYQPYNHLAKNYPVKVTFGASLMKTEIAAFTDDELQQFDAIIWHKTYFDFLDIEKAKNLNIPVIVDFDDHWIPNREHTLWRQYQKEGLSGRLYKLILKADYIICSTSILADAIYHHNQMIEVLPNAIDPGYETWEINRKKEDKFIFGYLGGPCHVRDMALLRGVQGELSAQRNDYQFRLFGFNGTDIYKFYADILSDSKRSRNFSFCKGTDIYNYPGFYNLMDCSLIPLEKNNFNRHKSALKMIEAAWFKKPVIVSDVEPYHELINEKNCLAVRHKEDWVKHCNRLLNEPNLAQDLGENLHELMKVYHIDQVNKKRYKFLQECTQKVLS